MSLCAVAASLWLLTSHCNMAIMVALKALGHYTLTMEKLTVLELIVVEEALLKKSVCLF